MTQKDIQIIDKMIDEKIDLKLKNINNLHKQDVKTLLFNYKKYKNKIEILKYKLLNDNITLSPVHFELNDRVQGRTSFKDNLEKIQDKKDNMIKQLKKLEYIVSILENCLDVLKDNEYFEIIKLRYIDKKSIKSVLEDMNISISTYKRHHNYMIEEIKSLIFI